MYDMSVPKLKARFRIYDHGSIMFIQLYGELCEFAKKQTMREKAQALRNNIDTKTNTKNSA